MAQAPHVFKHPFLFSDAFSIISRGTRCLECISECMEKENMQKSMQRRGLRLISAGNDNKAFGVHPFRFPKNGLKLGNNPLGLLVESIKTATETSNTEYKIVPMKN